MFEHPPSEVKVVEVGPRDGLQNETAQVATLDKVKLIEALGQTGLREIEITSFVSPKWIPQLADGLEVARAVKLPAGVLTSALVPNLKGYASACEAGLEQINLFLSASQAHSRKNINKSVDEAMSTMKEVAQLAKAHGKRVRCYVSCVFACPYEGKVNPKVVTDMVPQLLAMGIDEISLGDTIGAATPNEVWHLVKALDASILPKIALHFHDTRGTALANVLAGLEAGITIFDSSLGGLGGCPYAVGASGNLASEDLVYMLNGMGIKTGIDLEKLVDAGELAQKLLNKNLPGRYLKAKLAERLSVKA